MTKFWQTAILGILTVFTCIPLHGQDDPEDQKKFKWDALNIRTSLFSQNLGMLNSEREEYASNLAAHAANEIVANGASIGSLEKGRRLLALAMHLSPRNKHALVIQFQLNKGMLPEKTPSDYSPQVFARLLLTRGQLLLQQPEAENATLAHYLIQLAAEIDPRNEDAVYASELIRLDHGSPDWKKLTNPPKANFPPDL